MPSERDPQCMSAWSALAVLLLLCEIALFVFNPIGNNDFWAHAKTGEWIWQHRAVPRHSLFMYSAEGYPWINFSWLSALLFYGLYRGGGTWAILLLEYLVVVLSFAVLWRLWIRLGASPAWGIIFIALAISIARFRLQPRPEIFSSLGISLLLFALFTFRRGQRRHLWRLPLLFVLWTNLHGGVMIGQAILLLFLLGETCQLLWQRSRRIVCVCPMSAPYLKHLLLITALCWVAMLLNPYGLAYLRAIPYSQKLSAQFITEWKPLIYLLSSLDWTTLAIWVVFAGLVLSVLVRQRRSLTLSAWLLLMVFSYFAWSGLRHIWVAVEVCLATLATAWSAPDREASPVCEMHAHRHHLSAPIRKLIPMIPMLCILQGLYYIVSSGRTLGVGIDKEELPIGAVDFIRQNHIEGKIANSLGDSPYLVWELCPRQKLLIDVMTDHGPEQASTAMLEVDARQVDELVKRWQFDYAVLSTYSMNTAFAQWLRQRRDWALVYWDGQWVIYVKRIPKFHRVLQKFEYLCVDPYQPGIVPPHGTRQAYLAEVERAAMNPVQTSALWNTVGILTLPLGEVRLAEFAYNQSLSIRPLNLPARLGLAQCCLVRGDFTCATRYCRIVRFFRPDVAEAREMLAWIARVQGDDTKRNMLR